MHFLARPKGKEEIMEEYTNDSYCGIYCGACEIQYAMKNKTEKEIAAQWGANPEEIKCHGCKSEMVFKNCAICGIRKCAREKNVDHCVVCKDFPCAILMSGESLVERLPHLKAIPKNMQTIKEKGGEYWLKEQEQIWKCSECGEPFSWYKQKCTKCGRDISQDKDFMKI
jgi:hypothetical protein